MNGKRAKRIKRTVAMAMYVDDEVTLAEVKKNKHEVYASADFKPVYRSAKKNALAKARIQSPNHMQIDTAYDEILPKMMKVRKRAENYKKQLKANK